MIGTRSANAAHKRITSEKKTLDYYIRWTSLHPPAADNATAVDVMRNVWSHKGCFMSMT